jgi:hypothetical protein
VSLGVGVVAAVVGYRWFTDRGRVENLLSTDKSEISIAKTAHLRVEPGDVIATVNEQPAPVVAGALALTGQPGEAFAVVISKQGRSRTATVVLARDGTLNPRQLVLESVDTASAPAASSSLAGKGTPLPPASIPGGAKSPSSRSHNAAPRTLAEKSSPAPPAPEERPKPEPKRPPSGNIAPVDSW